VFVASSHLSAVARGTAKDVVPPATGALLRTLLDEASPAKVTVVGTLVERPRDESALTRHAAGCHTPA
jgi:hypothetical protein